MPDTPQLNETIVQEWLVDYLLALGLPPEEIDTSVPFDAHGLDSSGIVGMIGDLGEWSGCKLRASIVYDHPTIEALAHHLVETAAVKA